MYQLSRPHCLAGTGVKVGWAIVSQKGPGKESCDLKSFIFGISCIVCGNVFKQAWEDSASFLLGLCKEKEEVMKELRRIKLFIVSTNTFFFFNLLFRAPDSGLPGLQMAMKLWPSNGPSRASSLCYCRQVGMEPCCLRVTRLLVLCEDCMLTALKNPVRCWMNI